MKGPSTALRLPHRIWRPGPLAEDLPRRPSLHSRYPDEEEQEAMRPDPLFRIRQHQLRLAVQLQDHLLSNHTYSGECICHSRPKDRGIYISAE